MTIVMARRGFVFRFVACVLLIFLIFAVCIQPPAEAIAATATVVTAGAVSILASMLIASGMRFASQDDAIAAAVQAYGWMQIHRAEALTSLVVEAGNWIAAKAKAGADDWRYGIRVTREWWDALVSSPVVALCPSPGAWGTFTTVYIDSSSVKPYYINTKEAVLDHPIHAFVYEGVTYSVVPFEYEDPAIPGNFVLDIQFFADGVYCGSQTMGYVHDGHPSLEGYSLSFYYGSLTRSSSYIYTVIDGQLRYKNGFDNLSLNYPFDLGLLDGAILFDGDIAYPSDVVINMPADIPVEEPDGQILYPSIPLDPVVNQTAVADIPIVEGAADVPYDTVIDLSTGAVVDDVSNPDIPVNPDIPSEGGLLQGLWDFLAGILQQILDAINALGQSIINGIGDLLKSLFVPSETFFQDEFTEVLDQLKVKMPLDVYEGLVAKLQNVGTKQLKNITVVLYGQTLTLVDWSWYLDNKSMFDNIIRGFMWVFLLLFNVSKVYETVRGTPLIPSSGRGGGEAPSTALVPTSHEVTKR